MVYFPVSGWWIRCLESRDGNQRLLQHVNIPTRRFWTKLRIYESNWNYISLKEFFFLFIYFFTVHISHFTQITGGSFTNQA